MLLLRLLLPCASYAETGEEEELREDQKVIGLGRVASKARVDSREFKEKSSLQVCQANQYSSVPTLYVLTSTLQYRIVCIVWYPEMAGKEGLRLAVNGKRDGQIAAIRRLRACREFIPVRETSLQ